ncbi:retinal-specific phospholipid-transporting ATPase ABCA4-like [Nasonia vitripennis]|uniref:ABC transporter domain-containing protein n=1 Tax=Nasonia vitripennis TaxID=7425 RepID=A0A7M7H1W7_NASVI|nr:retinal-specific phospholipid-transporting ATPase ABCA4-like [Nasonia vitripennis]
MIESLRVLRLLFYKNYLMRKRQWIVSLLAEFVIPVGLILTVWAIRSLVSEPPMRTGRSTYYPLVSQKALADAATRYRRQVRIHYAPNSDPVKDLMRDITDSCLPNNQSFIFGYPSERELIRGTRKDTENGLGPVGIVFDDFDNKTKNLKYKILSLALNRNELYNIMDINMTYYYTESNAFTIVQLCLDEAFAKSKSKMIRNVLDPEKIFIQQMPLPPYTKLSLTDTIFRQLFGAILVVALMIPLFIETLIASNERFLGVNVLMSMNGVSNGLNLFSWLVSNWIFLSIVIVLPTVIAVLYSVTDVTPFLNSGNPFIIWIVFNIHVAHLLAYGLHVSSYFSKSLLVIFGLLILNVGSMALQQHGFNEDSYPIAPYLGIFLPNFLIYRAVEELNYYETIGSGVQWSNLFDVGNTEYKFAGSMGMVMILSIIGLIFHFTMAVYMYAINPGKYGVKKHPLFFIKRKSSKTANSHIESVEDSDVTGKPFETVPGGAYTPGITIRNLKKDYSIGFFKNAKVQALRGVSIDFYKGQITSLLGHNGAGKTTMMSILTGMMSPSEGVILVNSKDIESNTSEVLNDMGLCTQENMLFPNLTVIQQLTFFAMLKGKDKSRAQVRSNVYALLEKLKLYDKRNVLPKTLSGGQKRRVCLGMALVGDPGTLILDEPTSGLDPESRRVIWDILLKMRGQKTILISTHDMEEADILGDRIAILHTGQLRSYGTAMFLKKLIGEGNVEVTLSVGSSCYPEKILRELDCRGKIINQDGSKVVVSIPNSPDLPEALDKVERKKKELGITGLSVSLISLEQVFLKVTQEDDAPATWQEPLRTADSKPPDFEQCSRALLRKKVTYTWKNLSTIIIMLSLMAMALLAISLILKETDFQKQIHKINEIKLSMYKQPEVFYKMNSGLIRRAYNKVAEEAGGKATNVGNSSLSEALINYAKNDLTAYENKLIAAAEVNSSMFAGYSASALYSNKAVFSLPISVNLMTNTLIKSVLGEQYSISVSSQTMISKYNRSYSDNTMVNAITTAIIFCFLFFPTIALFALHPLRETSTYVKQLQRMAGVPFIEYWGNMMFFDMGSLVLLLALLIGGFVAMDEILGFRIFDLREPVVISAICYMLFALNTLPLVYCFSFINLSPSNVIRLLTYIPVGFVVLETIMYTVNITLGYYKAVEIIRPIQKGIFLLVPYVSFFHSQISFYTTALTNARCKRMPNEFYDVACKSRVGDICCTLDCYEQNCVKSVKYFSNFENDVTLEESLIYMCVTPILYIGILFVLDHQLIQKIKAKLTTEETPYYTTDDEVKREKSAIGRKISTINGRSIPNYIPNGIVEDHPPATWGTSSNQAFLVYGLRKQYGELMAVKDVSFGVNQRECFGLLGVNGAGKSTTFRMMTGGEVPDSGIMYIGDKSVHKDRIYFHSRIGYCPQNDALISSLNAYDHLRLFGRLRCIPEDKLEAEVAIWINKLNLNACAKQPSGTYSGGNKRRLNIAIALIGVPSLVLLDEPTTGVDPGARRSLWNVIQSCQTMGQAVVLTSHSMEECEALCNRLAIMVDGRLVCIGPSQELKQRFGAGYDIHVKLNPEKARDQVDGIKNDMRQALTCELTDENAGYLMYHVTPTDTTWRKMYNVMNVMKSKYDCIEDFSVLSSTLEQLFLLFARAANKETTKPKEE